MLLVADTTLGVMVRNLGQHALRLEMWRRPADPAAYPSETCALWSDGLRDRRQQLQPGETAWFYLMNGNADECRGMPVSFMVGNYDEPTVAWWSDSQMTTFQRQMDGEQRYRADPTPWLQETHLSASQMREKTRDLLSHRRNPGTIGNWQAMSQAATKSKATLSPAARKEFLAHAVQLQAVQGARERVRLLESLRLTQQARPEDPPYYLTVQHNWPSVTISNDTAAIFDVRVSRVSVDDSDDIALQCVLGSEGVPVGGYSRVSPGRPVKYVVPETPACVIDPQSDLQLEVRNYDGALVWMSKHLLQRELAQAESQLQAVELQGASPP